MALEWIPLQYSCVAWARDLINEWNETEFIDLTCISPWRGPTHVGTICLWYPDAITLLINTERVSPEFIPPWFYTRMVGRPMKRVPTW